MCGKEIPSRWEIVAASVRGASHNRSGLPNQDAFLVLPEKGIGSVVILSIADGHGSAKSFRSDIGAKFAVQVCVQVLNESWANVSRQGLPSLTVIKRECEDRLPKLISRAWRQKVDEHCAGTPFSLDEISKMTDKAILDYAKAKKTNYQAYGATLLAVMMTETFMLCLQLGDGDILVVSPDFSVKRAIPKDAALIANETTSLCMSEPENEIRTSVVPLGAIKPALVMLSTDGYSNSFSSDEGYLKAATDILTIAHDEGIASIRKQTPTWLEDASKSGSGDDITLGLIFGDIINVTKPAPVQLPVEGKCDPSPMPTDPSIAQVKAAPVAEKCAPSESESAQPVATKGPAASSQGSSGPENTESPTCDGHKPCDGAGAASKPECPELTEPPPPTQSEQVCPTNPKDNRPNINEPTIDKLRRAT